MLASESCFWLLALGRVHLFSGEEIHGKVAGSAFSSCRVVCWGVVRVRGWDVGEGTGQMGHSWSLPECDRGPPPAEEAPIHHQCHIWWLPCQSANPDGKECRKVYFSKTLQVQKCAFWSAFVCVCTILEQLNVLTVCFKHTQSALPYSLKTPQRKIQCY